MASYSDMPDMLINFTPKGTKIPVRIGRLITFISRSHDMKHPNAHCVLGNMPSYLQELFILTSACSGHRSLHLASFLVPRARTATRQKRAFSILGPSVWNGLPSELRSLQRHLSTSFYKLLKTLLFGRAWAGSASE